MTITGITAPLPPVELLVADFATTRAIAPTTGPTPTVARNSIGYAMNASGVWVPSAVNVPRFHHFYLNGQIVSGGLLVEPEFTNLLLHSNDLTQAWTVNSITPTLVAGAAPDGGNAWRLTDTVDDSPTFHRIFQTLSVNPAGQLDYVAQIFVKAETIKSVYCVTTNRVANQITYNLADETASNSGGTGIMYMRRLPNDWFFLAVKQTSSGAGTNSAVQWWLQGATHYQGDGTGSILIWNPCFGAGNTPTTPIITGAAAVTRVKDSVIWDGGNFDDIYDPVSGTITADVRTWEAIKDVEYVRVDDETTDNSISMGRAADGDFEANVTALAATQMAEAQTHIFNDLELVRCGVSYKRDNMIGAFKGRLLTPDTTAVVPFEPTRLVLGDELNGTIAKVVTYSNQSRSYSELRDLTGAYQFLFPDDLEALGATVYTDYQSLNVTRTRAKMRRIYVDISNYYNAAPGARIRVLTTVPDVKFIFEYDDPQPVSYNGAFSVLVNDVEQDPIVFPNGSGEVAIQVIGTGSRTIEVIMPYGSSWLFKGIQRFNTGTLTAPAARPAKRIACFGDSITNGYFASRAARSWPFLLAGFQSAQLINCGYGSETSAADRGTEAGNLLADITTFCIGYNDFGAQTALATYKANVQQFVDEFRAVHPTGKLYLGGPFYTPNTNTLTPAMYRTQVADVVTSESDPNTILLNTLGASTNAVTSWPDGIHPNNVGSLEIATAFNGAIV